MAETVQRGLRYGAIEAGIVVAVVLLVIFFPWNALRGPMWVLPAITTR